MLQDFKKFLMRGNVVDLAVGVVIGAAFTAVVTGFVAAFITPLLSMFMGKTNFSNVIFTVGKTTFPIGSFITPLITFVITASVVFFFVITPINKLMAAAQRKEAKKEAAEMKTDAAMLEELKKINRKLTSLQPKKK